jgi:hypothetical protein
VITPKFIRAAAFLFCAAPALTFPARAADAVPDATAAEKIGAVALKAKLGDYTYGVYMRDLKWAAMENGDYWFAMPVLQPDPEADLNQLQGWTVQIDRRSGKVIGVYLQF